MKIQNIRTLVSAALTVAFAFVISAGAFAAPAVSAKNNVTMQDTSKMSKKMDKKKMKMEKKKMKKDSTMKDTTKM